MIVVCFGRNTGNIGEYASGRQLHTIFRGPRILSGSCRQLVDARRNPRKELFWALLGMPGAGGATLVGRLVEAEVFQDLTGVRINQVRVGLIFIAPPTWLKRSMS